MKKPVDCCFCIGKDWFRYRVGAIIVADGYALFSYGERVNYYYTVGGGVHVGERSEDAVMREVSEETGESFEIVRPLCMVENFFDGDNALEGLDCHTIEVYYLMTTKNRHEYTHKSYATGGDAEVMKWIRLDEIDNYDIRPSIVKKLLKELPQEFKIFVNDDR